MSVDLLRSLINASEKASNIARICRSNKQLLSLLVQEKTGDEANARFQHDFKTLADVLIQETIKHDIGKLFPAMRDAIKGEESPNFTTKNGVTVSIEVGPTALETASNLALIIEGEEYQDSLNTLAAEVHRSVEYNGKELGDVPELLILDYSNLAIWIDPIDATAEYISGISKPTKFENITAAGLDCVTVLIGVFERDTGSPVIGVVSQPFFKQSESNSYESNIIWGVALAHLSAHNCSNLMSSRNNRLGIFSSSEQSNVLNVLKECGYETVFSAGAGHKALKVITNDVDIYVLSKGSTFKWDTCGPQAILRAMNGNMFDFTESVKQQTPIVVSYADKNKEENSKCNTGGIIAVREVNILPDLLLQLGEN